jgi:hypothetical protein
MPTPTRYALGLLTIMSAVLGFQLHAQQQHIDRLDAELAQLRDQVATRTAEPAYAAPALPAPAAAAEPAPPRALPQALSIPPTPRVAVTQAEIAHVESAVLSLLESDRPELREKLRAVVREQRETIEQEEREERRERWATRREARLLELGKTANISAEQQQAMLHIMLATRDQLNDLRQSAQTPEAISAVREQARALRDQSEAQIKELLTKEQYEAYSESRIVPR